MVRGLCEHDPGDRRCARRLSSVARRPETADATAEIRGVALAGWHPCGRGHEITRVQAGDARASGVSRVEAINLARSCT